MKIILYIIIVVVKLCASDSSVYDWHVRTIERDTDFGDDLKVQTALNNERQQDLFKISGKTNGVTYYPNFYYDQLNKNIDESNYKAANLDNKYKFGEKIIANPYGETNNMKYEDYANRMSILEQTHNADSKFKAKYNKKFSYGNDEDDYDYNEDPLYFKIKSNHQKEKENNYVENNNSNHDLKHIEHNSYYPHTDHDTDSKNGDEKTDDNKRNKNLNKNEGFALVTHCSGKYMDIENFVGTNLFDSTAKRCFSNEEVALLATRKDFESLIPKDLPECLLNDHMVALLLNYFDICHQMLIQMTSVGSYHLAQKAFYDTLGGYLNFYLVPVTKYSYYAGQISLNTAQQILNLHQESKQFLNTNGNGWKAPLQNVLVELKSVLIEPLHVSEAACDEPSFCMHLDMTTDENQPDDDKMIVQLPKLEAENEYGYLGNIWLPFRRKKTFDLKSKSSEYVVFKFYETVAKCYRFEKLDQEYYNRQFKTWLLENINVHLSDEQFYPGLGAVLRIYEYLKRRKKTNKSVDVLDNKENEDESLIKYHKAQIRSEKNHNRKKTEDEVNARKDHINGTNGKLSKINKTMEKESQKPERINIGISKSVVDQQPNSISEDDNKLEAADHSESLFTKAKLRTIELTPPQMAVIAIPGIAIILVIVICCCKSFCKKKKSEPQFEPKKNSSSSSSNLLNSPVRFFHIRKKSVSEYSSNDGNKKSKKSVKIEKKPLINSDTSVSSSPVRNKKSKESSWNKDKGKNKDSGKSNSKSSWETTYSSK